MTIQLERICKEAAVAYLKHIPDMYLKGLRKTKKTLHVKIVGLGSRFEQGNPE
jgi:hypothetical protein